MDAVALSPALVETSSDRSGKRKAKIVLLELAHQLGSVSKACQIMGYSRDSFYRFKRLYEAGGEAALQCVSRRKPLLKNRVNPDVERAVLAFTIEQPTWGQARVAAALTNRGVAISAGGVRCVWLRNRLQTVQLRRKAAASSTAGEGSTRR